MVREHRVLDDADAKLVGGALEPEREVEVAAVLGRDGVEVDHGLLEAWIAWMAVYAVAAVDVVAVVDATDSRSPRCDVPEKPKLPPT